MDDITAHLCRVGMISTIHLPDTLCGSVCAQYIPLGGAELQIGVLQHMIAGHRVSCVLIVAVTSSDTSSYSAEEQLVASVWVHERPCLGQTMIQVMMTFHE
jgi:hypothetical protein